MKNDSKLETIFQGGKCHILAHICWHAKLERSWSGSVVTLSLLCWPCISLSACMCVTCMLRVVKAHSYYCNRILPKGSGWPPQYIAVRYSDKFPWSQNSTNLSHHKSSVSLFLSHFEGNGSPAALRDCILCWCLYNGKRGLCNKWGTNTTNPEWAIWKTTMPPSIIYLRFIIFSPRLVSIWAEL